MSVVGPRPERPEIAKEYEESIPEFCFRLKVKAGLTGYAQIYGKYNTTPYDKLKLDMYYIQHYKVWTDIQLILMTFKIMFMKDNTEGVEKEQKTAIIEKNRWINGGKLFCANVSLYKRKTGIFQGGCGQYAESDGKDQ